MYNAQSQLVQRIKTQQVSVNKAAAVIALHELPWHPIPAEHNAQAPISWQPVEHPAPPSLRVSHSLPTASNQAMPFPLCLETLKDQNDLVTEEVTARSPQRKLKCIDFKVYFKSSKIKQVEARLAAVLYFYAYGEERHMTSSQF